MGVPINNVTRRVVYAASGTGPYAFTFEILAAGDIAVYRDDTLLTLTTDYTVTIAVNGTGSITLTAAPTGATQIAIVGNRSIQRTTDFVTGGDFFANTLNSELDQQTIFAQQNAEGLGRALQAPQTDPTTIDMTLPRASVRANKTLAFDANGDPTTGEVIGDNRGNWASGVAYNKRDIVKDTSTGNIYYCNTSHTSSGSQPITTNADSAKWDLFVDNASADAAQTAAEAAQAAAEAAQAAAETAETNAETAETNAETAATNAANSATAAASSASTASTAATNAGNSATAAATSATNASNSATAASTSATNAANSATSASNSASTATTQASNAATSATNAANSASAASSSASTATTQAGIATTQASNAATSASNASSSASAAATSASDAATSAAAAATALDNFDDRYLGAKSANPTLDNDGNALLTGALYYRTTAPIGMKVYDGSQWLEASAAQQAILTVYQFTATAGQTTFTGTDANGLTLGYTPGSAIVTLNGVVLEISSEVAANTGASVVLVSGAAAGDELNVYAFSTFNVANAVQKSGDTMSGALAINSGTENIGIRVESTDRYAFASFKDDTTLAHGRVVVGADGENLALFTAGTERARVDSTGNVGIGTSSPSGNFQVSGANPRTRLTNTSGTTTTVLQGSDSGAAFIGTETNAPYYFVTNNIERARIDASGNLLVGKTSKNNATNGVTVSLSESHFTATDTYVALFNRKGTDGTVIFIQNDENNVGSISVSGTSTAYNTSSDYRLKNTIAPMTGALEKVAALKPVTYKWNADGSDGEGFIAHELAEVVPQCVTGEKDAVDADGNPQYQGIDTSFLVATLTAAIQEQQAMIEELKAKVAALENA